MSKQPLVSIIMTYYNNLEHIEAALKSAVNQTYKNTEIVLVDDCSPNPEATKLIDSLAEKYKFKLLRPKHNIGASAAFHMAFEASKGEYISVLSHDDMYVEDKIEYQMKLMQEHDLDVVYCNGAKFQDDDIKGAKSFDSREVLKVQKEKGQKGVAELISSKDTVGCLLTQGALYKRFVNEELGWMRRKFLLDDWPFTIKVWRDYKTAYDDHVVYLYRYHDDNIHKIYWKWFPARIQTIAELVDADKKVDVTAFMLFDLASAMRTDKKLSDSIRFALAGYFMTRSQEVTEGLNQLLAKLFKDMDKKTQKDLKKKVNGLFWRMSFRYKIYRMFIKIILIFVWSSDLRRKIKSKFL